MPPLHIPADLPDFARDYLAQLDTAITASIHAAPPDWPGDPRSWVGGMMRNHVPDGTLKYFLHLYLTLLNEQSIRHG